MNRRPPRSTRTCALFPYTEVVRSKYVSFQKSSARNGIVKIATPHALRHDDVNTSTASASSGAAPFRRGSATDARATVAGGPGTTRITHSHHRKIGRAQV